MKQHRKCDTAKYKRRRVKEQASHAETVKRRLVEQRRVEVSWGEHRREQEQQRYLRRQLNQQLVDLLAVRACQLDPSYAAVLRLHAVGNVFRQYMYIASSIVTPEMREALSVLGLRE